MIESVIKHPAGRFTRCRACGNEPKHISGRGRTNAEPVLFCAAGVRHSLQCQCKARTAWQPELIAAEREWGTDYAQHALPLRRPRRKVA